MTDASAMLLEQILLGESAELRRLAAEGLVPLALEDLLTVQVALAGDENAEIASLARGALDDADPKVVASFLTEGTPTQEVLGHFARHADHPLVLGAVVDQRRTPPDILATVAHRLPPDLQERLLLRQDAIVALPAILEALERNGRLSRFSMRRIAEYRRHLVSDSVVSATADRMDEIEGAGVVEGTETRRVQEIRRAFEAAERAGLEAKQSDLTRVHTAQIRLLPVAERVALCKGAPRSLRMILIRDQHPVVAESVMRFNRLTDDEIEQVAKSRTVIDDVLQAIARDRTWIRRVQVVEALVRNPKTPVGVSIRLLARLRLRNLKEVIRDRNLPEALRSRAEQLYTIKSR